MRLEAGDTFDGVQEPVHLLTPPGERLTHRATSSSPPFSAATAARWETLATFDVVWDCRLVAAFTMSGGPIIQPTLQPVMA